MNTGMQSTGWQPPGANFGIGPGTPQSVGTGPVYDPGPQQSILPSSYFDVGSVQPFTPSTTPAPNSWDTGELFPRTDLDAYRLRDPSDFYDPTRQGPEYHPDPGYDDPARFGGLLGCLYHTWRLSDTIDQCHKEYDAHCGNHATFDDCLNYHAKMDAQWPSEAILQCVQDRDPDRLSKVFKACGNDSLKRIWKR